MRELKREGFADALTGETAYLVQRVNPRHLSPYLALAKRISERPTVRAAHDILSFDRSYQAVIFKYIGVVEAQARAQYAHRMREFHGDFALYDPSIFLRRENYERTLAFYEAEVGRQVRKSKTLRLLSERNGGRLPICDGIECATLGTLSKLFSNTADRSVTEKVSESFGCTKNELSSWLKTATDVRNVCAHFDAYAVRRQIPSNPLRISDMPASNNQSTFYIVLLLLHLMEFRAPFGDISLMYTHSMREEIKDVADGLEARQPGALSHLGFPDDWEAQMDYAGGGQVVFVARRS